MDERVVKLQVKLYMEGDEENAISIPTIDITRTQRMFTSSVDVPNVDFLIREAARVLFEMHRISNPISSDPELLNSIKIIGSGQDSIDNKVNKLDVNNEIVVDGSNETENTNVQSNSENVSEESKQQQLSTEDSLVISVTNNQPYSEGEHEPGTEEKIIEGKPAEISNGSLGTDNAIKPKQLRAIVRKEALSNAIEHANKDKHRETGGVLLGKIFEDEISIIVVVTGIVHALSAVREFSSVNFTPETWAEIWQTIDHDKDYSNEKMWCVVGWYHTHPDFGVFLSSYDQFIQKEYFTREGHLALVIDPVRDIFGFFVTNKETGEMPVMGAGKIVYPKSDEELLVALKKMNGLDNLEILPASIISMQ